MWEDAMDEAASQQADQALGQFVRGGRTLADIGTEFEILRRERGLSPEELAQRSTLPLGSVRAIESGTRLPTKEEFARLATALELSAARLAAILRPVLEHQASGIQAFSWGGSAAVMG
jgi:ribosome-binding protein aMBF1 (putative translation factor)